MPDTTPNLDLPYILPAQAQKHVTHNEAIRALDALVQLSVADRDLAAPPSSPADGARYIVAADATGAWTGQSSRIAAFQDGGWAFYAPVEGWVAWVADEDVLLAWNGSAWISTGGGAAAVNPAPLVGVNTTADATNKLAVKSNAVLLSHDDVTPGTGDMRAVLNKQSAAKTASLLFQTNFSGRAEFGLTGNDDWHVKVSPNGTSWFEALVVDAATGKVTHPLSDPSIKLVRFGASGTYSKPAGLKAVIVTAIGGGGAGGGVTGATSQGAAGGGGGSGGAAVKYILASTLAASEAVTVGAGGIAASGAAGGNGGTTSFGSHCQATGGGGGGGMAAGTAAAISASGSGGTGSSGDVNMRGGGANGGVRLSASVLQSGMGGAGIRGGGGRALGGSQPGQAGGDFGGGGSGASTETATDFAGGSGAGGLIEIIEIY